MRHELEKKTKIIFFKSETFFQSSKYDFPVFDGRKVVTERLRLLLRPFEAVDDNFSPSMMMKSARRTLTFFLVNLEAHTNTVNSVFTAELLCSP